MDTESGITRVSRESRNSRGLARLAGRHWGVVSIRELRMYGYDDDAVRRHVRDGYLHPLYRAVYAVGHPEPPVEGIWLGAV